jgi:ribosome assembly protein YihI (activator of Der GTPase)
MSAAAKQPPDEKFEPLTLEADDIAMLREKELTNVLAKLDAGLTLSAKEWAIVEARKKSPVSVSPVAVGNASAASAAETPAGIAARYGVSEMTVLRCNEIGKLPDVGTAPPWHDANALAEWYHAHYRSDVTKPPTRRKKLPEWLLNAQKHPVPAPILPLPVAPAPEPEENTAVFVGGAPMTAEDVLNVARQVVADKRARWEQRRNDPAAERDYMDAAERLQSLTLRARRAGDDDSLPRQRVCEMLDRIHARIPRRLAQDLAARYQDARRVLASADPETEWKNFASSFVSDTCRRLTESRFADLLTSPA